MTDTTLSTAGDVLVEIPGNIYLGRNTEREHIAEFLVRRPMLKSGDEILAVFDCILYEGGGRRLGSLTFHDYAIFTPDALITWGRGLRRSLVDRLPWSDLIIERYGRRTPLEGVIKLRYGAADPTAKRRIAIKTNGGSHEGAHASEVATIGTDIYLDLMPLQEVRLCVAMINFLREGGGMGFQDKFGTNIAESQGRGKIPNLIMRPFAPKAGAIIPPASSGGEVGKADFADEKPVQVGNYRNRLYPISGGSGERAKPRSNETVRLDNGTYNGPSKLDALDGGAGVRPAQTSGGRINNGGRNTETNAPGESGNAVRAGSGRVNEFVTPAPRRGADTVQREGSPRVPANRYETQPRLDNTIQRRQTPKEPPATYNSPQDSRAPRPASAEIQASYDTPLQPYKRGMMRTTSTVKRERSPQVPPATYVSPVTGGHDERIPTRRRSSTRENVIDALSNSTDALPSHQLTEPIAITIARPLLNPFNFARAVRLVFIDPRNLGRNISDALGMLGVIGDVPVAVLGREYEDRREARANLKRFVDRDFLFTNPISYYTIRPFVKPVTDWLYATPTPTASSEERRVIEITINEEVEPMTMRDMGALRRRGEDRLSRVRRTPVPPADTIRPAATDRPAGSTPPPAPPVRQQIGLKRNGNGGSTPIVERESSTQSAPGTFVSTPAPTSLTPEAPVKTDATAPLTEVSFIPQPQPTTPTVLDVTGSADAPAPQPTLTGDDFTPIWGIADYFNERLYAAGITTYEQLADAPQEVLTRIGLPEWRVKRDLVREQAMQLAIGEKPTPPPHASTEPVQVDIGGGGTAPSPIRDAPPSSKLGDPFGNTPANKQSDDADINPGTTVDPQAETQAPPSKLGIDSDLHAPDSGGASLNSDSSNDDRSFPATDTDTGAPKSKLD